MFIWSDDTSDPLQMNTSDPLAMAFIGAQGKITQTESLVRPDEEQIQPKKPYRLVVEANHGFFEENNIGEGSQAVFATSP